MTRGLPGRREITTPSFHPRVSASSPRCQGPGSGASRCSDHELILTRHYKHYKQLLHPERECVCSSVTPSVLRSLAVTLSCDEGVKMTESPHSTSSFQSDQKTQSKNIPLLHSPASLAHPIFSSHTESRGGC